MAKAERKAKTRLPLRVFLVEDSSLFRERMAEHLALPGRVTIVGTADSEKSATDQLRALDWDVLILDLQLKQGNGLDVLKALRADGRPAHAKVIVLTNHDYYLYRQKATECGADYFFNKTHELHFVTGVLEQLARDCETAR